MLKEPLTTKGHEYFQHRETEVQRIKKKEIIWNIIWQLYVKETTNARIFTESSV